MKPQVTTLKNVEEAIAFAQAINPKKESLTIEKLRAFPGCEQYSEEESRKIVQTIHHLCHILFECMQQDGMDEAKVVTLPDTGNILYLNPVKSKAS